MRVWSLPLLLVVAACASPEDRSDTEASDVVESAFAFAVVNNCSGALFQLEGMRATDHALVITNGHCVALDRLLDAPSPYPAPGQNVVDVGGPKVAEGTWITLQGRHIHSALVTKLVFATMTGVDVGIYELAETFGDLAALGYRPMTLERTVAPEGTPVTVVSGLYNRHFDCALDGEVALHEGPYATTAGVRLGGCEIYGGVSGSPIMTAEGRFVGLANTHFEGSGPPCSLGNPCEIGATTAPTVGQSYGVLLTDIYACHDQHFDFTRDQCPWRAER